MIEATAEELSANRRVADAVVDAVTNMCDSIARIPWDIPEEEEEDIQTEEEGEKE